MSASTHWLATGCAQAVLERGGNAFDAATAGAFVLHVVEPHLNGPAGDMTGIFVTAEKPNHPRVLAGQGPAPAGSSTQYYRSLGLETVPGAGALAAAVPGAVDAWLLLLRDHGSWELADVLEFAIGYAAKGFPAVERIGATVASVAELFEKHWPSSATFWMPQGRPPQPDEILTNPAYAGVLRDLVDAAVQGDAEDAAESKTEIEAEDQAGVGSDVEADVDSDLAAQGARTRESGRRRRIEAARLRWKTGPVAEAIAASVQQPHRHADGGDYAGVLTTTDMADFSAHYEDAVSIDFRGYTISKTAAWGQGPVLLQALKILEGYDDAELDPGTESGAHLILEALKLALADRDSYYGDADVDLDYLLSSEYAAQRRSQISEQASAEFQPGVIPGFTAYWPTLTSAGAAAPRPGAGEPTVDSTGKTRGDTCHIDVVDRWGNMISATPSGGWLQSSPHIPELGFPLGTRLQMMWLDEGSPSSLAPGKRPRTTLSPTLVSREGEPVMALGTPGGDQQDQWQLVFLLRYLIGGLSVQQAIDAPTFHTTAMVSSFWPREYTPAGAVVEARLGDEVISGLRRRGHRLTVTGDWTLGRISCVTRDSETGWLQAGANPRQAQGYAAGR